MITDTSVNVIVPSTFVYGLHGGETIYESKTKVVVRVGLYTDSLLSLFVEVR